MPRSESYIESRRLCYNISHGKILTDSELVFLTEKLKRSMEPAVLSDVFFCCRQIGDAGYIPLIEPYLWDENVDTAGMALWTLCWLGQAERLKSYILEAADTGFDWDPRREVGHDAFAGAGLYLKTHRDKDFAQLLIRWTPPEDEDDLFDRSPPPGMRRVDLSSFLRSAGKAMGVAVGADPKALIEDAALYSACVKRFLAERQDG